MYKRQEQHTELKKLGAKYIFDYNEKNLLGLISNTGGKDVILDHLCDEYVGLDIQVANPNARIIGIGQRKDQVRIPKFAVARSKELELYMMSMFNTPKISDILEQISKMMSEDSLKVLVESEYPLEKANEAQERVYDREGIGKVVIIP